MIGFSALALLQKLSVLEKVYVPPRRNTTSPPLALAIAVRISHGFATEQISPLPFGFTNSVPSAISVGINGCGPITLATLADFINGSAPISSKPPSTTGTKNAESEEL